jgi:hypothetical protein
MEMSLLRKSLRTVSENVHNVGLAELPSLRALGMVTVMVKWVEI